MNMRPVTSSNISAIGYDFDTQSLFVDFAGSGRYRFDGVPPRIDAQLREIEADGGSIGRFFHHAIKGKFSSVKVSQPELARALAEAGVL